MSYFNRLRRHAVVSAALSSAAAILFLGGPAIGQDGSTSEEQMLAFNNHCRTCHVTNEDDHRLGPSLHDIIGSEAGSKPGFGYSSSMANADIVWDTETLDRFIADPDAVVPGNNMKPYSGIASSEERAKIIAYLEAESAGQ
ncbi:MAG: c-type cytochrome [Kiloniellales bacterium]